MIDTSSTFIAGYTVAGVILLAYIASLWVRGRRVRARLERLERGGGTRGTGGSGAG